MGYKVGLTEEARADLGAAVRFIAVDGAQPEAALRLGHELLDTARSWRFCRAAVRRCDGDRACASCRLATG